MTSKNKSQAIRYITKLKIEQKNSEENCDSFNKKTGEYEKCESCEFFYNCDDSYYSHCQKHKLIQQQIDCIVHFYNISESDIAQGQEIEKQEDEPHAHKNKI